MKDLYTLPDNLPVPLDDGACDRLAGSALPPVSLFPSDENAGEGIAWLTAQQV